jgi:hypothetical protein
VAAAVAAGQVEADGRLHHDVLQRALRTLRHEAGADAMILCNFVFTGKYEVERNRKGRERERERERETAIAKLKCIVYIPTFMYYIDQFSLILFVDF